MSTWALLSLSLALTTLAEAAPIKVRVHFFEALAPKDTTSSERYQKEYEAALSTGKALTAARLAKCGYAIEDKVVFYSASDPLEAMERAKASVAEEAWMLVGPRRSNHYVLLAQGAPKTPSISTMASSQEVEQLGSLHLSSAPFNREMAKVAAREAKRLTREAKRGANYASVVSEDCVTCVDFAQHFDAAAKKLKLKKLNEFKVVGESPDLSAIVENLKATKPDFVLLPNYSKVTAQAIIAIHKAVPRAFFVGGDGWGDSSFGFIQNAKDIEGAEGFTVRGFPSVDIGLAKFPLGKALLKATDPNLKRPGSGSALALLKIIDGLGDLLCSQKPKSREAFAKAYATAGKKTFQPPWGVSIYRLKDGNIVFDKLAGNPTP